MATRVVVGHGRAARPLTSQEAERLAHAVGVAVSEWNRDAVKCSLDFVPSSPLAVDFRRYAVEGNALLVLLDSDPVRLAPWCEEHGAQAEGPGFCCPKMVRA